MTESLIKIPKGYNYRAPEEELMKFTTQQLRHAANCLDRSKGRFPPISIAALVQKLSALGAHMTINPETKGTISFHCIEKNDLVTRRFYTTSELTLCLNLGPVDLEWPDSLYIKTLNGIHPVDIISRNEETHSIAVVTHDQKIIKHIWLNGAEKILCNSPEGLTAGQMKIKSLSIQ